MYVCACMCACVYVFHERFGEMTDCCFTLRPSFFHDSDGISENAADYPFNYHPLLMVVGWIFLESEGVCERERVCMYVRMCMRVFDG